MHCSWIILIAIPKKDRTAYMKFTRCPPPILQLFMGGINFVNHQHMDVWELLWIYVLTLLLYLNIFDLLFGVKEVESSRDSAGCFLRGLAPLGAHADDEMFIWILSRGGSPEKNHSFVPFERTGFSMK